MKVVLLERVDNLGAIGDVVTVKDGFARNFLLPRDKARRATAANLKAFELDRAAIEQRNEKNKADAQKVADKIDGQTYIMIRQAGETGQLYGSVAGRDVAEAIQAEGGKVERSQVVLNTAIKTLGVHEVPVLLHADADDVLGHVDDRVEDPGEEETAGHHPPAHRPRGRSDREDEEHGPDEHDGVGPEARDEAGREHGGGDGADREGSDDEPELEGRQPQAVDEHRIPGQEGSERGAVRSEVDRGSGDAGESRLVLLRQPRFLSLVPMDRAPLYPCPAAPLAHLGERGRAPAETGEVTSARRRIRDPENISPPRLTPKSADLA